MWGELIAAAAAIVVAIIELIAARDRKHTKKLVEESRTRAIRREKESRLSMDLMSATCRLSCDTAKAVRDGHTNGTLAGNLEKAFELYPEVKIVILVHLYGVPAKIDEIKAICERHGAILIEDAAESLGATYKGVQTGNIGKYNIISFNGNKIITGTTGGMLLTNDKEAAEKACKWSTQSKEAAPWYQHEEIGYNYRMSNVVAGVVRGQFPYLEEHIAQKKAIYERYKEGFKDLPVTMNPFDAENSEPNYWLSCMLINPEAMCKQERGSMEAVYESEPGKSCPTEILEKLAKYNAEGRPIWKPMHAQPIYCKNAFVTCEGDGRAEENVVNVGMDIFHRGLCLPSDNKMTKEQQEIIIEIVKSCFDGE